MGNTRVVDLFMADKVLAGEPVRVLPILEDGYWRWDVEQPPINLEVAETLVANFENRGNTGVHQSNLPLNVEHVDTLGKIGTIASLVLGNGDGPPDGLYATFDLTEKGKQRLEDGEFDYLSPEIVFDMADTMTGEEIGAFMVGCAATNYPFFGDRTAMFSREAGEHFEETGQEPTEGGAVSQKGLFNLIREAVKAAIGPPVEGELLETMEGNTMSQEGQEPTAGTLQIPEEFANRLAQVEAEAETFRQGIQERDDRIAAQEQTITTQQGQIGELHTSRLQERFSRTVESLPHVGAENGTLVTELLWLYEADDSEGQEHFTYWNTLLETVERGLSDSAAFTSAGAPGHSQGGSAIQRFKQLIQAEAEARGVTVKENDPEYARIAMEVAQAQPELYTQYMTQVRNGQ